MTCEPLSGDAPPHQYQKARAHDLDLAEKLKLKQMPDMSESGSHYETQFCEPLSPELGRAKGPIREPRADAHLRPKVMMRAVQYPQTSHHGEG